MKKVCFLSFISIFYFGLIVNAQTAEELKAERQALRSELTSKDNNKIEAKYAKIVVNGVVKDQPSNTGLNSVDGLIATDASLLNVVIAAENLLKEYKIEITESKDGEVDITKYKANFNDFVAMVPNLVAAGTQAAEAVTKLKDVQKDVKGLNPMSAAPTIKAANWAMDALPLTITKIGQFTKLLNNLINSIKASGNL